MKKIHLLILSVLTGVIIAFGWPARGFAGLLLAGFVPLLFVEDYIFRNREKFSRYAVLFYSYPAFLVWNALTTWWIYNSTETGAVLAVMINSLFMAVVFQSFHWSGKKFKAPWLRYLILIFYWMAFEYLHLNWSLNWPWLNLGNGFGSYYRWVQWYEYTGTFGGTLWIWISNLFLFRINYLFLEKRKMKKGNIPQNKVFPSYYYGILLFLWHMVMLIPILFSYFLFEGYKEKGTPVNIVVVQPNVDPYSEQYDLPPTELVGKIMALALPIIDSTTNFLVAPESAIQEYIPERDMDISPSIILLKDVIRKYPSLNIVIGASTQYIFAENEKRTVTARKYTNADMYYDPFNTAILLNKNSEYQLYHKSKLTPGVESLPTIWGWNFLEKFAIDLGGTIGSIGTDKIRKVYRSENSCATSPAICYESIFGEFFAEFVKNGAEVMFIITNDGWWGNSPGHRQHYVFSSLRAIETRRDVVRSANTGISAVINQRGESRNVTEYWVPAAFKDTVMANKELTFYVRYGDYLAKFAVAMTAIFIGISIFLSIRKRFRKRKPVNG